jgi:hypothetical protein
MKFLSESFLEGEKGQILGSTEPKIDDKSVISQRCPVVGSAMTNQQMARINRRDLSARCVVESDLSRCRRVRRLRRPRAAAHDTPRTWDGLLDSSVGVGPFPGSGSGVALHQHSAIRISHLCSRPNSAFRNPKFAFLICHASEARRGYCVANWGR